VLAVFGEASLLNFEIKFDGYRCIAVKQGQAHGCQSGSKAAWLEDRDGEASGQGSRLGPCRIPAKPERADRTRRHGWIGEFGMTTKSVDERCF
jgi:hypothetical protein